MRNLKKVFENRKIEYDKLLKYGFVSKKNVYVFEKDIVENNFRVIIEISKIKQISKVLDLATKDEYILADIEDAKGDFVSKIKEEYETILHDIIETCTIIDVFRSNQAKKVIQYVKEKYNDDLEYLWKKFPNNAIWRNKSNNKWYGVLLVIPKSKLGIESDDTVEIIDLRYPKEHIAEIVDHEQIFTGYHMNKHSWITIKLDDTVKIEKIYQLIDRSYELSLEK